MSDWKPMKHPSVVIDGEKYEKPVAVCATYVLCGGCGQSVREDTARPRHPGLHLSQGQACKQ